MAAAAADDDNRPKTWPEAEAMAEAALRQHDLDDFAADPMRTQPSASRRNWVQNWLTEHSDYERLLEEYTGATRQTAPTCVAFSARIIALVRVPWTPPMGQAERVVDEIHMLFSEVTPDEDEDEVQNDELEDAFPDVFFDFTDYTDYVRRRIPAQLLREAAAYPVWHGHWRGRNAARRELRAGFAERFAVEQSNVTTWFAGKWSHPIATLITMFLTARIDQSPGGRVPLRPMVQNYFPPVVAAAAASSRRGAGDDDPAGHDEKRARKSKG